MAALQQPKQVQGLIFHQGEAVLVKFLGPVKPHTHHRSIRSEGLWILGIRGKLGLLSLDGSYFRFPLRTGSLSLLLEPDGL